MMRLVAIVLTYNEAAHISDCVARLAFADRVIVFDSVSSDETVTLAREAGAEVIQREFDHYAGQRNAALDAVLGQADWVLFVDADERVTPDLAAEVRSAIEQPEIVGWQIPRHNYIFGRLTCGAGWYPDYQLRLLRLGAARYDPARQVHELVLLDGPGGHLDNPLVHYNYSSVAQFHHKQRSYSTYDARMLYEGGIRPKPQNYLLQPWREFWRRFVTLAGYTDGLHGLRLSLLMAYYELRKYLVLRHLWQD
jgi:glycosyltransferase involved in cell wall biosynthesis